MKIFQASALRIGFQIVAGIFFTAIITLMMYPIREFLDAGLKVTVNTDNRTVSNTTLTKELEFIQKNYRITDEEIHLMMRNAVDVAFADDAVKERIFRQLV